MPSRSQGVGSHFWGQGRSPAAVTDTRVLEAQTGHQPPLQPCSSAFCTTLHHGKDRAEGSLELPRLPSPLRQNIHGLLSPAGWEAALATPMSILSKRTLSLSSGCSVLARAPYSVLHQGPQDGSLPELPTPIVWTHAHLHASARAPSPPSSALRGPLGCVATATNPLSHHTDSRWDRRIQGGRIWLGDWSAVAGGYPRGLVHLFLPCTLRMNSGHVSHTSPRLPALAKDGSREHTPLPVSPSLRLKHKDISFFSCTYV